MQQALANNTTLNFQQNIISILLIMLMSVLPITSATASVLQCLHSPSSNTLIDKVEIDQAQLSAVSTMSGLHDCCEEANVQCDCDNGQVGSSLVNTISNVLESHKLSVFKQSFQPLFISKISDSLYRPPITIL